MSIERRRHARVAVEHGCCLIGPEGEYTGTVMDISAVGAKVATTTPIADAYERLQLRIEPLGDGEPLTLTTRVMYTRERDGKLLMGLQFMDLDAEAYRQLQGLLERFLDGVGGGKREHPRVQLRASVRCRTKTEAKAILSDISKGGLQVELDEEVAPGDAIEVSVKFGSLSTPLQLPGRVVRAQRIEPAGYRVGVRLDTLPPESDRLLARLLKAMVTQPAGAAR